MPFTPRPSRRTATKRLEVLIGSEADFDLSQYYHWVYEAIRDPHVARRFLDRPLDRCRRIGDAPHGERPREDLEPGLRTVPFEHCAVSACRVEADCVRITNVFYGGRDYEMLFRSDERD